VSSICRQLDGLPLAIELAAAQSAALTPPEIEERLATSVDVGGHGGSGPARQQTMDATLTWSHDLLSEGEQALFRRLAVFAGGWTLEAAERVCSFRDDPSTIAPTLVSLVEHSLVVRDGRDAGSRFRMLAPVAEYAARRLAASDERMPTSLAHAQYYLTLVSQGTREWRPNDPEQLDLIATEYDNCLAAMRFAERAGIVPIVLGLNLSLLNFWGVRGLLQSGKRRIEAALALVGDEPSRSRGVVLGGLAMYENLLGDHASAAKRAAEAEVIHEATGDLVARRTTIGLRGDIAADLGDFDAARAHYTRARPLVDADPNDQALAFWHGNVGQIALRSGDLETARAELEQALVRCRAAPTSYLGRVLVQLGSLARRRGDLDRAAALLGEALEHLRRYGAVIGAIACLDELARLALDRRDPGRAATLFAAATGLRDTTAVAMSAHDRKALARDIDRARTALAPGSFSAAWLGGLGLSLEQAAGIASSQSGAPGGEPSPPPRGSVLTPREREIAQLVALGLTNRQIAERLVITPGTARIHVGRILGKLGLTSRVQIATWVVGQPDGAIASGMPEA
jgi:DNA-binding CsgD family transcriptional regulator/tetratricopeptide (TPR) repeat protein